MFSIIFLQETLEALNAFLHESKETGSERHVLRQAAILNQLL